MILSERLSTLQRVFLDTAPLIYYVEKHPIYFSLAETFFTRVDQGLLTAVTSPITLAESLIFPLKQDKAELVRNFTEMMIKANHTEFIKLDAQIGINAAELRVKYNLSLMDALQIAAALNTNCDGFLTNDTQLQRISEIDVLVLQNFISAETHTCHD
jgi:predicted nucleic acid-binding protein